MCTADSHQMPKKQLGDRLGKNASQGPPPNDLLLGEIVFVQNCNRFKVDYMRVRKSCFWTDWAKMHPKGLPLTTPRLGETVFSKLQSA